MGNDLIIDLVRHMKARNAARWTQGDSVRPLSKLGVRQAEVQAAAMASSGDIVALYSSPAQRCRETMEPLAALTGLIVTTEPLLGETRSPATLPIGADHPLITRLRSLHPEGGRVVACSHADTIPAILESLRASAPGRYGGILKGFGGWYRVRVPTEAPISIERFPAPAGFPTD